MITMQLLFYLFCLLIIHDTVKVKVPLIFIQKFITSDIRSRLLRIWLLLWYEVKVYGGRRWSLLHKSWNKQFYSISFHYTKKCYINRIWHNEWELNLVRGIQMKPKIHNTLAAIHKSYNQKERLRKEQRYQWI